MKAKGEPSKGQGEGGMPLSKQQTAPAGSPEPGVFSQQMEMIRRFLGLVEWNGQTTHPSSNMAKTLGNKMT